MKWPAYILSTKDGYKTVRIEKHDADGFCVLPGVYSSIEEAKAVVKDLTEITEPAQVLEGVTFLDSWKNALKNEVTFVDSGSFVEVSIPFFASAKTSAEERTLPLPMPLHVNSPVDDIAAALDAALHEGTSEDITEKLQESIAEPEITKGLPIDSPMRAFIESLTISPEVVNMTPEPVNDSPKVNKMGRPKGSKNKPKSEAPPALGSSTQLATKPTRRPTQTAPTGPAVKKPKAKVKPAPITRPTKPTKPKNHSREHVFVMRLSGDEYERLAEIAKDNGVSMADVVRGAILS